MSLSDRDVPMASAIFFIWEEKSSSILSWWAEWPLSTPCPGVRPHPGSQHHNMWGGPRLRRGRLTEGCAQDSAPAPQFPHWERQGDPGAAPGPGWPRRCRHHCPTLQASWAACARMAEPRDLRLSAVPWGGWVPGCE